MEGKDMYWDKDDMDSSVDTTVEDSRQRTTNCLGVPIGFSDNLKGSLISEMSDVGDGSRKNSDFHDTVKNYELPMNQNFRKNCKIGEQEEDERVKIDECSCIVF
ncbi:hypothetical protein SteCoe_33128 [Stentor coeruleus]|uniref:Uncharacterized protein n=1 Tax=Stentor coeruleus TaxID=5963 RepID=A0A1R2AXF7_9CILI|nr:hypothetical protein SteCoe_33128 [Stentor coeruleus]